MLASPIALNHYQQLMLRLTKLTAYNAVHVVSMSKTETSLVTLSQVINEVIQQLQLGYPNFSRDDQYVTYAALTTPLSLHTRLMPLKQHLDMEMNEPFAEKEFPIRFYIVEDASECYFSVTYNHWIGDAYTISRLIESIFTTWQGNPTTALTLHTPPIEACFQTIYRSRTIYYRYLGVLTSLIQFSQGYRTPINREDCTISGNEFYFFDKQLVSQLRVFCKSQGITLNDLFVAILARLFGQRTQQQRNHVPFKWLKFKRDRIIIAVMSNIRSHSQYSLTDVFGLFLGFFYLSFKSPEQSSLHALCQSIHFKTQRLKTNYAAVKQYLLFNVQKKIWDRRATTRSQYRLFSKNTPITVGVSNMDLSARGESFSSLATRYIRFSPTAMVCPIVFNLTTFNGYLSLGINYRTTCYDAAEVVIIKNEFVAQLYQLLREAYTIPLAPI